MASSTSASGDERPGGSAPRDPSAGAGAPPQAHAEWAASLQAYYGAGGHPYAWPAAQHMMAAGAPYGAAVPFPVYHPAFYAHASMAAGVPYPAGEAAPVAEGNSKMKNSGAPSGDGYSGSSDGGSEESSDKRDASADQKVLPSAKRRKSGNADVKGEPSQAATTQVAATQDAAAELPLATRRSASKLSVSTSERAALSNATPNLNIGMDIWSNSPAKAETSGQREVNAGAPSQHAGALSQMKDERELKRERRKQSNRESARRSRLRKQQECEELIQKVTDLTAINGALGSELDQLKKACEDMEAENSQLMGEMEQSEAPSVLTTLSIQIETSKAHHGNNGNLHKKNINDSKG
ncbi:DNA-binding protein EMBP-1-like isoform X2 [Phragmites australis]|uniref:DNA-binding protein EMBP-1-like isoform X2 n=1 Tax=Phragmites australis TaxID=29695 RepID=UPI002D77A6D0|nr:DNA-binding protein EMBP-1-like isoform X2 [Phragmites australis]